ncbi:APC family permease [Nocardioides sp. CCNWLW212]|uniref:APC family permease n=1 Tax=Nocardioides sp. CCNWLW212 TaxID=3128897 RepID=UPI00307CDEE1
MRPPHERRRRRTSGYGAAGAAGRRTYGGPVPARDRARPSLRFRDRSVFEGVARREVGALDLVAHSVAVLVPSLTALGSGLAFPAVVGPGFWVSTLLGFGLVGLLTLTFNQFSTRFRSAGTLYTFVAKGLGPMLALVVGGGLIIGYSAMIGFGLGSGSRRAEAALAAGGVDLFAGTGRELVLLVVGASMCLYAISRGIHWSTRAALAVEVVSLVVLVVVLGTWIERYGWPGPEVLSLEGASLSRILLGAGLIVTLTLAYESSASLGLETKRPFAEVPFALRWSLVLAAVLFAFANLVATQRPADAPSVFSWRWFSPGADRSVADALVLVVLAWSLVALALCVWCALARLVFSLAREGVLPDALGRVNARGIPMTAALAVTPLAVLPTMVGVLAQDEGGSFGWELKVATSVVICTAYALTALSLLLFLRRLDEVTPVPVVAAVVSGVGAAAVAVNELVTELRDGTYLAVGLLVASAVLGLLMRLGTARRRVTGDRYVGMHDEALASSVILPPEERADSHADR